MEVRFLEDYERYRQGDIADLRIEAACELIKLGIAEQYEPEAATLEPSENAMLPRARGRKVRHA